MNLEMQTTLLDTYPQKMIATNLKALREQLKETDQLNAVEENAGPASEILLEHDQILKEGGGFWDDVNGGCPPDVDRTPTRTTHLCTRITERTAQMFSLTQLNICALVG